MVWILLATFGELLNATVAFFDKYIVSDTKALPRPFVYAFYSCLVAGFWVFIFLFGFIPPLHQLGMPSFFDVQRPDIQVVGLAFFAAYAFFMALVSMYEALKHADASDVMPAIGAIGALFSFGLSYVLIGSILTPNFIYGVLLLIGGTFLLSHVRFKGDTSLILHIIHSGLFFALHYITMKGLFELTNFSDGFFWSRVAFVLFALSLLLVPSYYKKITEQTKKTTKKTGFLVLCTKAMAGIATVLLLKATDLGNVTVVQSLDGLKFVFIIILGLLVGRFLPHTAGENEFEFKTVIRKSLYIAIIAIGFVILFT